MKKVMGILLASTLILGACGHHQDSAKKESTSHKKKENDNEELNEELVCQQFFRQFSCVDF